VADRAPHVSGIVELQRMELDELFAVAEKEGLEDVQDSPSRT
jgi:hypothetical protein